VRHIVAASDSFPIGELDGRETPRLAALAAAMSAAGLKAPASDVRQQMWRKLLGNIWANPIGALTGATVGATVAHPETRALALALMREVAAVAAALGIGDLGDFEQRLGRAAEVGDAKASMLQDRRRGRALGARRDRVARWWRSLGVAVPHARAGRAWRCSTRPDRRPVDTWVETDSMNEKTLLMEKLSTITAEQRERECRDGDPPAVLRPAEIRGVDLREEPDDATAGAIRQFGSTNNVLLRDQDITPEQRSASALGCSGRSRTIRLALPAEGASRDLPADQPADRRQAVGDAQRRPPLALTNVHGEAGAGSIPAASRSLMSAAPRARQSVPGLRHAVGEVPRADRMTCGRCT
jgi:hypothetical protein